MDSLLNIFSRPGDLDSCSVSYGVLLGIISVWIVRFAVEFIEGRLSLRFTISTIILIALIGYALSRRKYLNCKKSSV